MSRPGYYNGQHIGWDRATHGYGCFVCFSNFTNHVAYCEHVAKCHPDRAKELMCDKQYKKLVAK